MKEKIDLSLTKNFKYDFPAAIIVFLVAVPLCLGIAIASGAPPFTGIMAGIIGGIIVGALSGSSLGVSGPAAGLASIVYAAINDLGFETFLLALLFAGILQVAFGAVKAGIIGYYFPNSVIKGMLAGIGIIIILKQIPHAVGLDSDYEGDMDFAQPDGENTLSMIGKAFAHLQHIITQTTEMVNYVNAGPIIVTLVGLFILIIWQRPFMQRIKLFTIVQGPLVAILVGIVLSIAFQGTGLEISKDHLVSLPNLNSWESLKAELTFPDFSQVGNFQVYVVAITLALVASLETLLSVEATDKLDPYKRITPTNRELFAQGAGNIVAGLLGALPVTQVIVRSSANIQSGGRTKISTIIHGIMLIISVVLLADFLNLTPLASLAAVLFIVGFKLANPATIKQMYNKGWESFVPFVVTTILVVYNLLVGVGVGLAIAFFYILYRNYQTPYDKATTHENGKEVHHIQLSQVASFLNKAAILRSLNELPDNCIVIIDGSQNAQMHQDVVDILEDFCLNASVRNIEVRLIDLPQLNHCQSESLPEATPVAV